MKTTPPKTNTLAGKARGASGSEKPAAVPNARPTMTPAPSPSDKAYSNVQPHSKGVNPPRPC